MRSHATRSQGDRYCFKLERGEFWGVKHMKRVKLIAFLKDHGAHIRGYGVKSLALFGSVARDEATTKSDVDLLVEFEGKVTFDCYMDLKFFWKIV